MHGERYYTNSKFVILFMWRWLNRRMNFIIPFAVHFLEQIKCENLTHHSEGPVKSSRRTKKIIINIILVWVGSTRNSGFGYYQNYCRILKNHQTWQKCRNNKKQWTSHCTTNQHRCNVHIIYSWSNMLRCTIYCIDDIYLLY